MIDLLADISKMTEEFSEGCKACRENMLNTETGELHVHWSLCCQEHMPIARAEVDPKYLPRLRKDEQELSVRIDKGIAWVNENEGKATQSKMWMAAKRLSELVVKRDELQEIFKRIQGFESEGIAGEHVPGYLIVEPGAFPEAEAA